MKQFEDSDNKKHFEFLEHVLNNEHYEQEIEGRGFSLIEDINVLVKFYKFYQFYGPEKYNQSKAVQDLIDKKVKIHHKRTFESVRSRYKDFLSKIDQNGLLNLIQFYAHLIRLKENFNKLSMKKGEKSLYALLFYTKSTLVYNKNNKNFEIQYNDFTQRNMRYLFEVFTREQKQTILDSIPVLVNKILNRDDDGSSKLNDSDNDDDIDDDIEDNGDNDNMISDNDNEENEQKQRKNGIKNKQIQIDDIEECDEIIVKKEVVDDDKVAYDKGDKFKEQRYSPKKGYKKWQVVTPSSSGENSIKSMQTSFLHQPIQPIQTFQPPQPIQALQPAQVSPKRFIKEELSNMKQQRQSSTTGEINKIIIKQLPINTQQNKIQFQQGMIDSYLLPLKREKSIEYQDITFDYQQQYLSNKIVSINPQNNNFKTDNYKDLILIESKSNSRVPESNQIQVKFLHYEEPDQNQFNDFRNLRQQLKNSNIDNHHFMNEIEEIQHNSNHKNINNQDKNAMDEIIIQENNQSSVKKQASSGKKLSKLKHQNEESGMDPKFLSMRKKQQEEDDYPFQKVESEYKVKSGQKHQNYQNESDNKEMIQIDERKECTKQEKGEYEELSDGQSEDLLQLILKKNILYKLKEQCKFISMLSRDRLSSNSDTLNFLLANQKSSKQQLSEITDQIASYKANQQEKIKKMENVIQCLVKDFGLSKDKVICILDLCNWDFKSILSFLTKPEITAQSIIQNKQTEQKHP